MITDGKKETDGHYVEMGPGKQHIQIDLEKDHDIDAVIMWHLFKSVRIYHDVMVKVSNNPRFVKDVKFVYNSDHDNSVGLGVGKDKNYTETNVGHLVRIPKGVKGRYFRLYTNGSTAIEMNHYFGVEVHGKPLP